MEQYRAVVFGGSGTAGTALLNQLAATPEFIEIVLILRKQIHLPFSPELNYSKFKQVLVDDLENVDSYMGHLRGICIAFYMVGSRRKLASKDAVRRVEIDMVHCVLTALKAVGVEELHFVSRMNTWPNSMNSISKVKAEAEKIVEGVGFRKTVIYRPGYYLELDRNTRELSKVGRLIKNWLDPWGWFSVEIDKLSLVMMLKGLEVGERGVEVVENGDIIRMAKSVEDEDGDYDDIKEVCSTPMLLFVAFLLMLFAVWIGSWMKEQPY